MTDRPEFVPFEAANIGDLIRDTEQGTVFQVLSVERNPRYRITGWWWADDANYPDRDEAGLVSVVGFPSDPLLTAVDAAFDGGWEVGTPVRNRNGRQGTVSHCACDPDEMFVYVTTPNGLFSFDPQDNLHGWEIVRAAT